MLRLALLAAVLVGSPSAVTAQETALEMQPPQLSFARIDWSQALAALPGARERTASLALPVRPPRVHGVRPVPRELAQLNAAMSRRFPGLARSPVPVLLPFDTETLMRELAAGTASEDNERYLSGFRTPNFFYPGRSGYDAVFSLRTGEIAELADITFSEPIDVLISGSALLYELDDAASPAGAPVPALEAEFPGIRRMIYEHHLRYTFVRYGAPYVVSTACFDAGVSRYRMPTCRAADRVLLRFLHALRVAGGTPTPPRPVEPLAVERPAEPSPTFIYHPPGRLLPGTGFRGRGGRADHTVYSQIRFPIAEPPAFVNSQMFQSRNRPLVPGQAGAPNYSYPWRDNFCERRGFPVGQCPAGAGHQGQDMRTPACPPGPEGASCRSGQNVVAVRDGVILRRPKQEAVYLFVNTANEHLRFRYLHMVPRKMDEDSLFSGRSVREGEVISQVGNFHRREGGTSYHLHFDVQVPTRNGWVFVNPYMTLVAAYERLIGGRGEPVDLAAAEPATTGSAAATTPQIATPEKAKRSKKAERAGKKRKAAKHAKRHKIKSKKYRVARR